MTEGYRKFKLTTFDWDLIRQALVVAANNCEAHKRKAERMIAKGGNEGWGHRKIAMELKAARYMELYEKLQ